jgi:DNA-binding MarR family transcriptional regulator
MNHVTLSQLADAVDEMMPIFLREFVKRHSCDPLKFKVTPPQLIILNLLHKHGCSKMTDIARYIGVSTAAVTGIIDRLVKCGYVVRTAEPDDRRVVKVRTTPRGAELVKKMNKERRQMMIDIYSKISQKDRDDYFRVLMRLRDSLTKKEPVAK